MLMRAMLSVRIEGDGGVLVKSCVLATVLAVFGFSNVAQAEGVVLSPTFFYRSEETKVGANKAERTDTLIDARLGYSFASGLYLGAIYGMDNRDYGSSEAARTSYGATVGYYQGSWALFFHYFLSSQDKVGNGDPFKGTGIQFDFGYYFSLGSSFSVGPQISYKAFTYTKLGSNTLADDRRDTKIDPSVAFLFSF